MKRIYLLMILFIGLSSSVMAQSADIQLLSNVNTNDTIKWNTAGTWGRILVWGFRNIGPTALTSSDTIVLKRAYTVGGNASIKLRLPSTGVAVNDTVYYADTVYFKQAPSTNPYNWCDSVWVKRGSSALPDPVLTNNKICKSVIFKEMPTSIAGIAANEAGLAVYPNPANTIVNVRYTFASNDNASLIIRDMMGKVVYTKDLGRNSGEKNFPIDISSLNSGLYFVELHADNNKIVSKFTVQ